MTFNWNAFWEPITPASLLSAFIIGIAFGRLIYGRRVWSLTHVYWMFAAGVVFFVPLSLEQAVEGLEEWERFLAKLILWNVFVLGTALTPVMGRVLKRLRR